MANPEQLEILNQGIEKWNKWRVENPKRKIDLSGANLTGANLTGANFHMADLSGANLSEVNLIGVKLSFANFNNADLREANLSWANLSGANLSRTNLYGADLSGANLNRANLNKANLTGANLNRADLNEANLGSLILYKANLSEANLSGVDLSGVDLSKAILNEAHFFRTDLRGAFIKNGDLQGASLREANLKNADLREANLSWTNLNGADLNGADLSYADLQYARLVKTNLENANLSNCAVYGISAWDLRLKGADQRDLIITSLLANEPMITVDNIEVAQFIYLLLNRESIRHVIDPITSKVVLILGSFTSERKAVLDAIRQELRKRDYLPIFFDFEKSASRDITETISILAHMARFVIADITNARSISQELERIVPDLPSVPVQPLILKGSSEYGMFEHFKRYPWVLEIQSYDNAYELLGSLEEKVIDPPEAKRVELLEAS